MEVGAMLVGRIVNHEEKGSTITISMIVIYKQTVYKAVSPMITLCQLFAVQQRGNCIMALLYGKNGILFYFPDR